MHSANVSLEKIQRNQYHHVEKKRKRRLHDLENVSFNCLIKHHETNSWVYNEQENLMNNEDSLTSARFVHEISKE